MERESFEDQEVAELLNRDYVAIKVDREERPDIDHIYMTVCQGMTGHGGWPLTIVMTPDKKPYFSATYLPKDQRHGLSGLMQILPRLADLWKNDRSTVLDSGEQVARWLKEADEHLSRGELSLDAVEKCFRQYTRSFDAHFGGFGAAPKFPTPHNLYFLLRYHYYTGEPQALHMVEKTLDSMYAGGIYDHIGFGFARYSTDHRWLVPHFEKMLYDNALLATAYLETYQTTGQARYARVADEILTYILRDMTSAEGGFFSAEDADSEGVEGKFYVWTPDEVEQVLGEAEGKEFCRLFDITRKGNFEGRSIPNLIGRQLDEQERARWEPAREKLLAYRSKRVPPHQDDKVLTAWNGLMIAALATGYRVLGKSRYEDAARKAVDFVLSRLRREDGRLLARYRDGEASYLGYSADYSHMIWGLLEMYAATYEARYLGLALELMREQIKYFWDEEKGGFYFYGSDAESLLTRPKELYDGAMPSDNSVAALNLLRLARLTGDEKIEDKARIQLEAFASTAASAPTAYAYFLTAIMLALQGSREVVVAGPGDGKTEAMLDLIKSSFLPDTVALYRSGDDPLISSLAPFTSGMNSRGEETAAYVCEQFACRQPLTDGEEFKKALNREHPE